MQLAAHPRLQLLPFVDSPDDASIIAVNPAARRAPGLTLVGDRQELESREAMLDHLERLGEVAPGAPLSFLLVGISGLGRVDAVGADPRAIVEMVGDYLGRNTRLTDVTGRFTGSTFGVILQGAGEDRAAAVAQRLSTEIRQLPGIAGRVQVDVAAATGTGVNAELLPGAAFEGLPQRTY